jgi:hypothetical protein
MSDNGYETKTFGQIELASWDNVLRLLRLIPQYDHTTIGLVSVQTAKIISTARYVRDTRLARARTILQQLLSNQIAPFQPVILHSEGRRRLVVPPVTEVHDSCLYLMDGTHRIWAARERGLPSVIVVMVSNVNVPLPSEPVAWRDMSVRNEHYTTEENLINFNRSLFRPLTTTFNSNVCFLE